MLNISNNSINDYIDKDRYSVFKKLNERSISKVLMKLMIIVTILGICSLFLPWTQNIRSNGYVSSLNPDQRPQSIQSLIDGRIKQWNVTEGDDVQAGDTILIITESKEAYLDPNLLSQTQNQIDAKKSSSSAYQEKAGILGNQYASTLKNKEIYLRQNTLKILQEKLKIKTDSIAKQAAVVKLKNSEKQRNRVKELYEKGIKSLTDLEIKNLSVEESVAKVNELENKMLTSKNELNRLANNTSAIANEYDQKLSKINSDKMSAISMQYSTTSEVNKLESSYNNYKVRSDAYVITSPITGKITQALKQGIGEFIKAGEDLVTIVPAEFTKAVEIYVRPRDIPLLEKGQSVRIQFDGWPAIVFSGWPGNSFGTFVGEVYAIDNDISKFRTGKYRVLLTESEDSQQWPEEIRIGGGANGIILLKEVSIYYEIWRQLNGFPPDYYQKDQQKNIKTKAPIKKFK